MHMVIVVFQQIYKLYTKELRFITAEEAEIVLGPTAIRIDGFSVVVYDTEQFMRVCCF